ncbi:MAG TPA: DUF4157 domain-containing protein [Kofleriaceae bacterium]|nr:DUF4157 domain-containing protein [Kofleriaceae bacterium]
MAHDLQARDHASPGPGKSSTTAGVGPGKQSLVSQALAPVQRKETGAAPTGDVHAAAARGTAGAGGQLPHLDAIQRSFGRFDVSGVQAHTGGAAHEASVAMGARAFATGNHVAFGAGGADLHTAAHEAAHVVQQRAGVSLKGGVGAAGDAYEQHADAVADKVVAGQSAEGLLAEMAGPGSGDHGVQRKEVETEAELHGAQDWTRADREGNSARWQAACLRNLNAADSGQFVKVVERRDFYHWFYEYSASRGFTTRWALAAWVVANGAHQIADMDAQHALANETLGMANVELQGAMREGNQVIFDNVLPKLRDLINGGPLTGREALRWDMRVLSEEQTLIQPMYARMSPQTRRQLEYIARKQRFAGLGAWWTGEDQVAAGPHNNAGTVPGFNQPDLQNIDDRWRYGMGLGNQFAPGGNGYTGQARPAAGAGYTDGSELARVDTRQHLHELDAWLNPNRISRSPGNAGSDIAPIIAGLSAFEKQQVLADHSADGWAYSTQLGKFSISEAQVRAALPSDAAAAGAVSAFLDRYRAEYQRTQLEWQRLQRPPMMPF